MKLRELQRHWHRFGQRDPLWSIVSWDDKARNRWNADEFFKLGQEEIGGLMACIQTLLPTLPQARALDFGCGVGRLSQALASHFEEVIGVDIAPSMIKHAQRYNRHGHRCRYYLNQKDDLRLFESATFDLIYSTLVLQHMMPVYARSYIKEFLRILAPGGLLVFQLPSEKVGPPGGSPQASDQALAERSGPAWRRLAKRVIPERCLEEYRRFRDRNEVPTMEMYAIKREEVEVFLVQNGARMVYVEPYQATGPEFVGFRYFATKADAT